MSDVVKTVFINYIACAVFGGILEYIAPEKSRKMLRTCVISLMLVTSLAPVLQADVDFGNIENTEEIQLQNQYDALMHTANLTEKKIYGEMKDILINCGVDEYEIYVSTRIEKEENTVYLDEIRIDVHKLFESKIPQIQKQIPEEYKKIFKIGVKNE